MNQKISPGNGHCARCWTRITASAAAAALLFTLIPSASAANGDGVTPTCDEAYYATTDYYGNLSKGSVVKSYSMNGKSAVTDYGTYKKITNLTDDTKAETSGSKTTFHFGKHVPDHFYFEGETSRPFDDLPWKLSLTYKLNGVPIQAGKLKGKSGMVEIDLDMVPNRNASEYARNNYTLETMTAFNQSDILSLKAEGAQVQLVGNLRVVLFVTLPGEEQHVSIQVGADDFQFDGMTYLMVPATLSQLKQISDLKEKKGALESDYKNLSSSFDQMLSSMSGMSSSLDSAASGLDEMGAALGSVSGAGEIYSATDLVKADLGRIAGSLEPMADQLEAAGRALTETQQSAQKLVDTAVSLKKELSNIHSDITKLQNDGKGAKSLISDTAALKGTLASLKNAIAGIQAIQKDSSLTGLNAGTLDTIVGLGNAFDYADTHKLDSASTATTKTADGQLDESEFVAAMALGGKKVATGLQALQFAAAGAGNQLPEAQQADYAALTALYSGAGNTPMDFSAFCKAALLSQGVPAATAAATASQMDQIWRIYNGSDPADQAALEMVMDNMGTSLGVLNTNITNANTSLASLSAASRSLITGLENLCGELTGLNTAIDDTNSAAETIKTAAGKGSSILDALSGLSAAVNSYLPTARKTLKSMGAMSKTAAAAMTDTATLIGALETCAKQNGQTLTSGSKKALSSLSSTLRQAAKGLGATGSLSVSKKNIDRIITDTWEKYTGKVNNLLNMDASAAAESLTSGRNAAPESVQVLIRTHEIKTSDEGSSSDREKTADKGTFWSRLSGVFSGIWKDITGKSDD